MQRAQSASALAAASQAVTQAEESLLQAQARYHLAVELQRRYRAHGQEIDPVLYELQVAGADIVRRNMVESRTRHEKACDAQFHAQVLFSTKHAEHKLVKEKAQVVRGDIWANHGKSESHDSQDQAASLFTKEEMR